MYLYLEPIIKRHLSGRQSLAVSWCLIFNTPFGPVATKVNVIHAFRSKIGQQPPRRFNLFPRLIQVFSFIAAGYIGSYLQSATNPSNLSRRAT